MGESDLERSIFDTIRYFDIFALPVTAVQIWRSLIVDRLGAGVRWRGQAVPSLRQVHETLAESAWLRERVADAWGYYCLRTAVVQQPASDGETRPAGRPAERYVQARLARHLTAQGKWKIAHRAARRLAALPLVRMIGVTGSLALSNTQAQSDIDLLVVVRRGRIWTARLLLLLTAQLMGRRRTYDDRQAPDKLCLNHFITDDALVMAPELRSVYTAVLYEHVVPLFGLNVYRRWRAANAVWIKRWLKYPLAPPVAPRRYVRSGPVWRSWRRWMEGWLLEPLGEALERWAQRMQRRAMVRHAAVGRFSRSDWGESGRTGAWGRIALSDTELAFHPDSQAMAILSRFGEEYGQGQLL